MTEKTELEKKLEEACEKESANQQEFKQEEKNEEMLLFIQFLLSDGNMFIGMTSEANYNWWVTNDRKLVVHSPRSIRFEPMQQHGNQMSLRMSVQPVYPIKSSQETLVFEPSAVEVLGSITEDDDGMRCNPIDSESKDMSQLFMAYCDSLTQWKYELAGLTMPTGPIDTSGPKRQ